MSKDDKSDHVMTDDWLADDWPEPGETTGDLIAAFRAQRDDAPRPVEVVGLEDLADVPPRDPELRRHLMAPPRRPGDGVLTIDQDRESGEVLVRIWPQTGDADPPRSVWLEPAGAAVLERGARRALRDAGFGAGSQPLRLDGLPKPEGLVGMLGVLDTADGLDRGVCVIVGASETEIRFWSQKLCRGGSLPLLGGEVFTPDVSHLGTATLLGALPRARS